MPDTSGRHRLWRLSPAVSSSLSLSLLFTGLAISVASCAACSISYIPPTYQFGLFQMLPGLFWVGLVLCVTSVFWGIIRHCEKVFLLKMLVLCLLLWNIPLLVLEQPYFWDGYAHVYEAMPIMLSGHVPESTDALPVAFRYYPADFPGFHILLVSASQLSGIPMAGFIRFYPIFSSLVTFFAMVVFFRTFVTSSNYRWALFICVLGNVYLQFHLSPQSLGLVAGMLVLVAMERAGIRWKVAAVLLFAFVVISHPTTAFILVPVMGIAWILRFVLRREMKALTDVTLLLVAIWLGWILVEATFLGTRVAGVATAPAVTISDGSYTGIYLLDSLIGTAGQRLETIYYHAPRIRFSVLAVFGLVSGYYLFTQWINSKGRKDRYLALYTAFVVAPVLMVVVELSLFRYANLYDRYFLFFLLTTPVLAAKLLEREGLLPHLPMETAVSEVDESMRFPSEAIENCRFSCLTWGRVMICGLVIVAIVNFGTWYYQSSLFVYGDDSLRASRFVQLECDTTAVIEGQLIPDLEHPLEWAAISRIQFGDVYPQPLTGLERPFIVIFDDYGKMRYQVWYGMETYDFYVGSFDLQDTMNKVYQNSRYRIFWLGDGQG